MTSDSRPMSARVLLAGALALGLTLTAAAGLAVAARQILVRAAPTDSAPHAFFGHNHDGSPIRWDPCGPIEFVLDPTGGPDGWETVFADALARVSEASGLTMVVTGQVSERPSADRSLTDNTGWLPVLVAWAPPQATGLPTHPSDRAVAVPVAVGSVGERTFVTGQIVFNPDRADPHGWAPLSLDFVDRSGSWGATMLHKLGHLLGLAHVDDPAQLMHVHPGTGPVTFGAGDRAGLEKIGTGGCRPTPPGRHVG